jgi:hypothetical protein
VTVATLLTLIQILSGLGSVSVSILKIRDELEKQPLSGLVPPEQVAAIKAAMGSGGSVWDEDHLGN